MTHGEYIKEDVYLVVKEDETLMKSGKNFTVATFASVGQAQRWARYYNGIVVRVKSVEDV